jgi:hypothetical protein
MNALNQQMKHDAKMNTMRQQSLAAQSKALEQSMAKKQTDHVQQRRVQAVANARAQPEVYKARQEQQQSWDQAVAISNASRNQNAVNPQNPMGSHSYYGDNYKHHYNNNLKQQIAANNKLQKKLEKSPDYVPLHHMIQNPQPPQPGMGLYGSFDDTNYTIGDDSGDDDDSDDDDDDGDDNNYDTNDSILSGLQDVLSGLQGNFKTDCEAHSTPYNNIFSQNYGQVQTQQLQNFNNNSANLIFSKNDDSVKNEKVPITDLFKYKKDMVREKRVQYYEQKKKENTVNNSKIDTGHILKDIEKHKMLLESDFETNQLIIEQLRYIEHVQNLESNECQIFEIIEFTDSDHELHLELLQNQIYLVNKENRRLNALIEIFNK